MSPTVLAVVAAVGKAVEPLAHSLALTPGEDEEITLETAAMLDRARVFPAQGKGIAHENILREFGLSS